MKTLFLLFCSMFFFAYAVADDLADIKKRGVLVVGVKDATPPFGMLDANKKTIAGYDVDFAIAVAQRLGVKVLVKGLLSAERIPALQEKRVDMIIATLSKNSERERQVDFSYGYFVTGQKFAVRKGRVKNLADLANMTIGSSAGSNSEKQLRQELPNAKVVLFTDYDLAFQALQDGQIDAVSTDEPILAGQLGKMATPQQFEIPDLPISLEIYGIAVRRGESRLLQQVNATLLNMEHSGEAARIFARWFGPGSSSPMNRLFQIRAK